MNFQFLAKAVERFFAMLCVFSGVAILENILLISNETQAMAAMGIVEAAMMTPVLYLISLLAVPIETK